MNHSLPTPSSRSGHARPTHAQMALVVMAGGAMGALSRFLLNAAIMRVLSPFAALTSIPESGAGTAFPVGILCINVLGGFIMGLLHGLVSRNTPGHAVLRALIGTGFLGGFTTFSTFSADTLQLWLHGHPLAALLNIAANVSLAVLAAGLGHHLGKTGKRLARP